MLNFSVQRRNNFIFTYARLKPVNSCVEKYRSKICVCIFYEIKLQMDFQQWFCKKKIGSNMVLNVKQIKEGNDSNLLSITDEELKRKLQRL